MKSKSDAIVAALVIACSLVLLGALLFSISGNPFKKPHLQFSVDFRDVTGITANSAVLYGGNDVGVVDGIEHLPAEARLTPDGIVRAHISITREIPLPANIDVLISSESMLGAKHIALKRRDDEGGLLADGAQLEARSAGSMLESLVPGGGAIVANLESITADVARFTDGLGKGTARKDIGTTLENFRELTDSLKTLISGSEGEDGLGEKLTTLADSLNETSTGVKDLVSGPEGAPEEGLGPRTQVILANLESFSSELNTTLAGDPDGEPGLRDRLNEITGEVHAILAGNGGSEEGLRTKLDSVMTDVETLVLEIQALVVWGEYVTGTLAEKPSRLIWGSKENEVPTKEEIIEHLRNTGEPYPVKIREIEDGGRSPAAASPKPKREGASDNMKRGLFKLRSTRG